MYMCQGDNYGRQMRIKTVSQMLPVTNQGVQCVVVLSGKQSEDKLIMEQTSKTSVLFKD